MSDILHSLTLYTWISFGDQVGWSKLCNLSLTTDQTCRYSWSTNYFIFNRRRFWHNREKHPLKPETCSVTYHCFRIRAASLTLHSGLIIHINQLPVGIPCLNEATEIEFISEICVAIVVDFFLPDSVILSECHAKWKEPSCKLLLPFFQAMQNNSGRKM